MAELYITYVDKKPTKRHTMLTFHRKSRTKVCKNAKNAKRQQQNKSKIRTKWVKKGTNLKCKQVQKGVQMQL